MEINWLNDEAWLDGTLYFWLSHSVEYLLNLLDKLVLSAPLDHHHKRSIPSLPIKLVSRQNPGSNRVQNTPKREQLFSKLVRCYRGSKNSSWDSRYIITIREKEQRPPSESLHSFKTFRCGSYAGHSSVAQAGHQWSIEKDKKSNLPSTTSEWIFLKVARGLCFVNRLLESKWLTRASYYHKNH